MSYASCPSAVVDAPVDIVWALLVAPAGWESVFDMRIVSVDPPGPAAAGQEVRGETGPEILHLKLTFRMMEVDPDRYRLRFRVNLPFGLIVDEDMRCMSLDETHCRVSLKRAAEQCFAVDKGALRCSPKGAEPPR